MMHIARELPLSDEACYAAMQSRDVRFDGRFFCGVSSTGIYCRPICRVRVPKKENCTFFVSAPAAEAAGYRPCLRCRPELAPGLAPIDLASRLARSAALLMEEDDMTVRKIPEIAYKLGISDRHLRRVFLAEYGVPPVQYIQTRKLLLAKSLLWDTSLTVTDVAMAAGFGSLRRFNGLFKTHYRLTPRNLRRKEQRRDGIDRSITLSLGYRPPYAWDHLISFLAARSIPGVESVSDGTYRRTVTVQKEATVYSGWISVSNEASKNLLAVTVASTLLSVLSHVLVRTRLLFDLDCSPERVHEKLAVLNRVTPDLCVNGIRVPGCFDPFELSVRTILGQQVSVSAARTLAARLVHAFGERIETPFEELSSTFPSPERICSIASPIEDRLGPLGITGVRARSILALSRALVSNSITLSHGADSMETMKKLIQLPGFGPWTVQYIAMRALGWPDAFPPADRGIEKALVHLSPGEIEAASREWSPWRSYATILLWHSLESGSK
jgi:AraC family transcriptional regulator, regulatory protein of adaptative response / DNA-3-methyladenine glycosylase II